MTPLWPLAAVAVALAACNSLYTPTRIFVRNETAQAVVVRTTAQAIAYFGVPPSEIREIPDDPREAIAIFDANCRFLAGSDDRGNTPRFITWVVSESGVQGEGGNEAPPKAALAAKSESRC